MIISDKQKEYINNANHRYNIKIGARRCGKTYLDILYMIPKRIIERKGKEGLNVIFGVSKGTIERNVLQPLREIYGKDMVTNINSANIVYLFGEEVYCLGCEKVSQVSKIQGTSIKYAYGDEVAKWNQDVFIMIQGSLDKPYSCFDGALNPESNTHWLKTDFLDVIEDRGIDAYVQSYTIFDNPFLSKEFVENLCKEYEGTVYYNRLILGQWCNAEGLIFIQIANEPNKYITDKIKTGIISIGIDWGGNGSKHSITASVISRDFSNIEVLASDLMISTGTNTKQVFRWINNFIQKVIDNYGMPKMIFCDSAEQVLNNSLRSELQYHIPIKNSIKTPIEERIKCIIRLLNSNRISFLNKETKTIVEALQTALYDETSSTDRWIDDGRTSDIDSLDSFVYSWEYYMPNIMSYKGGIYE